MMDEYEKLLKAAISDPGARPSEALPDVRNSARQGYVFWLRRSGYLEEPREDGGMYPTDLLGQTTVEQAASITRNKRMLLNREKARSRRESYRRGV